MTAINATSFLLLKEQTVLGHSSSTVISLNQNLPESTTKDSQGWKEFINGLKSGTIQAEGLCSYDDTLAFDDLEAMLITRQSARFVFKQPGAEQLIVSGTGFIESITETAEAETVSSYQVEIKLTGAYVVTDITEGRTWDLIFTKWEDLAVAWENV
jgi:predicted secreted protein